MGEEQPSLCSCSCSWIPETASALMKKLGIRNGELVDLESGLSGSRRRRSYKRGGTKMKSNALMAVCFTLCLGTFIILLIAFYDTNFGRRESHSLFEQGTLYPYRDLKNLVMVAGHSVYTGSGNCEKGNKGNGDGEEAWYLEEYQKHPGQAATFVDHIRVGIESVAEDGNALLLFSGGETRKDAGPRSEAQSYWNVADTHQWFGKQIDVRHRALTEEHARDSFENLLFSICRFRELTGSYPHNITVVSYDFKEKRFASLHRSALRFPAFRFFYVGTPASPSSAPAALKGEALVREQFQKDPYGCSRSLRMKRIGRDPFHRTIPYPNGCPELRHLFEYCGRTFYSKKLPWDD